MSRVQRGITLDLRQQSSHNTKIPPLEIDKKLISRGESPNILDRPLSQKVNKIKKTFQGGIQSEIVIIKKQAKKHRIPSADQSRSARSITTTQNTTWIVPSQQLVENKIHLKSQYNTSETDQVIQKQILQNIPQKKYYKQDTLVLQGNFKRKKPVYNNIDPNEIIQNTRKHKQNNSRNILTTNESNQSLLEENEQEQQLQTDQIYKNNQLQPNVIRKQKRTIIQSQRRPVRKFSSNQYDNETSVQSINTQQDLDIKDLEVNNDQVEKVLNNQTKNNYTRKFRNQIQKSISDKFQMLQKTGTLDQRQYIQTEHNKFNTVTQFPKMPHLDKDVQLDIEEDIITQNNDPPEEENQFTKSGNRIKEMMSLSHSFHSSQQSSQEEKEKLRKMLKVSLENMQEINSFEQSSEIQQSGSLQDQNNNIVVPKGSFIKKSSKEGIIEEEEEEPEECVEIGKVIRWKQGDFLGAGNFAQVFRAINQSTGKVFAVKRFNLMGQNSEYIQNIKKEIYLMENLKHENIIQFYGSEQLDDDYLYVYLEYMDGGNLLKTIKDLGGPMSEDLIRKYAKQILQGLEYLHKNNIVHKDIKCANILQNSDAQIKLADFGCSKQIELAVTSYQTKGGLNITGTIEWLSPEVVTQSEYGRRSDIWSFGCTILEMATGKNPWSQYKFDNEIAMIMKIGCSQEIPLIPDTLSESLQDLLKLCIQRDRHKRPYSDALLKHKFFQETN